MNRYYAILPAAGSGSRMGAAVPKQYLELAGRPVLWHAIAALAAVPRIERVLVMLSPGDVWWTRFDWSPLGDRIEVLHEGGETRAETVANALAALAPRLDGDDWVLVHDAARACVTPAMLDALIDALSDDEVGGLLAQPVADTLKRSDASGRVAATVSREAMWQAQTPQMFRYQLLRRALVAAPHVTDEAGAVEALGLAPRLVPADATNFKVTYPQDLALAELILQARSNP